MSQLIEAIKKIHLENAERDINDRRRGQIERQLEEACCSELIKDGYEPEGIKQNRRHLFKTFHPDKITHRSDDAREALHWLEEVLGNGQSFKIAQNCFERLSSPPPEISETTDPETLLQTLRKRQMSAVTLFEKGFYGAISSAVEHLIEVNLCVGVAAAQHTLFAHVITSLSVINSVPLIYLYSAEIALAYALGFLLSASGSKIQNSEYSALKFFGAAINGVGRAITFGTTTLLFHLFDLHLKGLRLPYTITTTVASYCYNYLTSPELTSTPNSLAVIAYEPSLKLPPVSSPYRSPIIAFYINQFQNYSDSTQKQWFLSWRMGSYKKERFEHAIKRLKFIDKQDLSPQALLDAIGDVLDDLLQDTKVNAKGSQAHALLDSITLDQQTVPRASASSNL